MCAVCLDRSAADTLTPPSVQWRKLAAFVEPEPRPGGITEQLEHDIPMLLSVRPLDGFKTTVGGSTEQHACSGSDDESTLERMLEDLDQITELQQADANVTSPR